MRKLVLIAVLAALLPGAEAQRTASCAHFPTARPAAYRAPVLYPIPFLWDSAYSDAEVRHEYPAIPPTVIVLEAPPRPESAETVPPPAPLLIELRGNRYVRLSGEGTPGTDTMDVESVVPATQPRISTKSNVHEIVPTVLVFRDGHREEISDYTIAAGVLYVRGNYYTDGSWNRKIDLWSLNLPETIDANRSRGLKFQIPAAANEVIVGP